MMFYLINQAITVNKREKLQFFSVMKEKITKKQIWKNSVLLLLNIEKQIASYKNLLMEKMGSFDDKTFAIMCFCLASKSYTDLETSVVN